MGWARTRTTVGHQYSTDLGTTITPGTPPGCTTVVHAASGVHTLSHGLGTVHQASFGYGTEPKIAVCLKTLFLLVRKGPVKNDTFSENPYLILI